MNNTIKLVSLASVALVAFSVSAQPPSGDRLRGLQENAVSSQVQEQHARQLRDAATGPSFRIGRTQYRVVPDAAVTPVAETATPSGDTVLTTGRHAVSLSRGAGTEGALSRSRRSAEPAGDPKFAVAVSDAGTPLILTSDVKVFFDDPAAVDRAARRTGGKVVGKSEVAGRAFIAYDSAEQALQAMERIQGEAGIRGVEPTPESQDTIE